MERLAEEALAGADKDALQSAIKDHLARCPDCQEHHQRKLDRMEEEITAYRDSQE